MIIPATRIYPDAYACVISWAYWGEVGEGAPVEVYAWPRMTWQFTGDNVQNCTVDIYGTNEVLETATCWGKLFTMTMPIHDRMSDPFVDASAYPIPRVVKPIVRGVPDAGNNLGVILFCTRLFSPGDAKA